MAFTITPLTDHTASEVTGFDFTQPIDSETRAALARYFGEPVPACAGCDRCDEAPATA